MPLPASFPSHFIPAHPAPVQGGVQAPLAAAPVEGGARATARRPQVPHQEGSSLRAVQLSGRPWHTGAGSSKGPNTTPSSDSDSEYAFPICTKMALPPRFLRRLDARFALRWCCGSTAAILSHAESTLMGPIRGPLAWFSATRTPHAEFTGSSFGSHSHLAPPAYVPACLPACLPACPPACMSDWRRSRLPQRHHWVEVEADVSNAGSHGL